MAFNGGRGGIRTPDRLSPMPVFKTGAFNHSATRPNASCLVCEARCNWFLRCVQACFILKVTIGVNVKKLSTL